VVDKRTYPYGEPSVRSCITCPRRLISMFLVGYLEDPINDPAQ